MADVILLGSQLDLTCLRNTARLLQLFHQFDGMAERVRLVANRAGSHSTSEISLKKAEETLQDADLVADPQRHQGRSTPRGRRGCRSTWSPPGARSIRRSSRSPRSLRPFPVAEVAKAARGLFAAFF